MHKSALLIGLSAAALMWSGYAFSQSGSSEKIPDFSVGWSRIGDAVETFEPIPGHSGAGPVTIDPKYPRVQGGVGAEQLRWVADLSNPIFKPETLAKIRAIAEAEIKGIPHIKDEGMCMPSGVPMLHNRRGGSVLMLQTPTQITILNARDHQYRIIYLNVPHSKNPKLSWYGESVGHYEGGDTLVVDTIAQNDKTQIDRFGTPHSDQIHVVERFKISPDGRNMEVQFTVNDPGAYTMPWSGRVRYARRGGDWDEQICAENNRFVGTVTIDGKITTDVPVPTDNTPDF
jgi:hypothetical protein